MQVKGGERPAAIYSDFTPEVTTTCRQLSESSRIKASISSGEVQAASAPYAASSFFTPGAWLASFSAAENRAAIGVGRPRGATAQYQFSASSFG